MKTTFPIITCDDEDGCDQWTLDWHRAEVSNWQECMEKGWHYEPYPYGNDKPQFCPEHAPKAMHRRQRRNYGPR